MILDWKTAGNYVLLVGLFVAMVTMFNQVNGRLDNLQTEMNRRFDTTQAESNRRFDAMQAEMNRRFEAMQTENNRRFDEVNRRFDQVLEALRVFEGRISRLEEKAGIGPENAE